MPAKTDKSKLLHNVVASVESVTKPTDEPIAYVYDGNTTLQSLAPIPDNFEGVAEMVFNLLSKTSRVDFVTDTYKESSTKSFEQKWRGSAPKFLLSWPKTKAPRDMANDENTTQIIKFLFDEWKKDTYAKKLQGREINFAIAGECYLLSSTDGETVSVTAVKTLFSSQEEADTRIILHCMHISQTTPTTTHNIVRSPDTDVLVLLLKYAQNIHPVVLFDTGTGNKRRLLNVKQIVEVKGSDLCSVLPALHCFTGCDAVSAFVQKGKLTPLKVL